MKTKAMSVVAAVLVLLMITAACGGGGGNGNSAGPATTGTGTPAPAANEPAPAGDPERPYFIKDTSLKLLRNENVTAPLKADAPVIRAIQRQTGIKLEVEVAPDANYADKTNVLIGTNNLHDLMRVRQIDVNNFARTGVFLNLSDYMEYMPNFQKLFSELPEQEQANLKVDGNLYAFPTLSYLPESRDNGMGPAIRMDILDELNLEVPTTFDELFEVLKAMKAAYPDSRPFATRNIQYGALAYAFGTGYNMYYDPDIDGGSYEFGTITPAFKEMLTYLNKLYEAELLDADFATSNSQKWIESMSTGKGFFLYDNLTFSAGMHNTLVSENPKADLRVIPTLKNSRGQARPFVYSQNFLGNVWVISANVKDPVAAVKLLDWMYSEDGMITTNYGMLGETYEIVDGKPKFMQSFLDKIKFNPATATSNLSSELGSGFNGYSVYVLRFGPLEYLDPIEKRVYDDYSADPAVQQSMRQLGATPSFTEDEQEQIKRITSQMTPIITENLIKFVMGVRPLDQFEQFARELIDIGVLEMKQLHNDALNR